MRKSGVKHTTLTKIESDVVVKPSVQTVAKIAEALGCSNGRFGKIKLMAKITKHEASIPNPELKPLSVLIGKWKTVGTHPLVPDTTFHGHTSFEWLEGGAFLIMHSEIDEPDIPSGIAIFGSDDVTKEFFMLYFDERGVSRKYNVTFKGKTMTWWRNTPEFSQHMKCKVVDEGDTIVSKGEMSKDGSAWEDDLELTYTRVK